MPVTPEAQRRFEEEERAYWRQREELLKRYPGKWVAIVGGEVVAVGDDSGEVLKEAIDKTGSTSGYLGQVGAERKRYRIREVARGRFDDSYHRPLPKVVASMAHAGRGVRAETEFVVDTGADLTVVRHGLADALGLWDSSWRTAEIGGIGGQAEERRLYAGTVQLADRAILVEVDCRDDIDEDILGRDVINEFALSVCAKRDEVRFEWVE